MATNRVKVVGNNFDPYLVGLQWATEGGTPLFTIGNFQITTNLTPPPKRNFQLGEFSDPITLDNLNTTLLEATQLVENNLSIFLNLNTENLLSFTLFGSFKEFIRVELEQIIANWPGSIYVFYNYGSVFGNTVLNYIYDPSTNTATFDVSTNFFYNNFNINYLQNATFSGTSLPPTIRNISVYYNQYEIYVNGQSYPIIGFVGSTTITNGFVTITVAGDPFNGTPTSTLSYHIRPNSTYVERFFSNLSDFGRFLLNRTTVPQYTANIYYETQIDTYQLAQRIMRVTWPTSDGYNLDVNTGDFLVYKEKLLSIAISYDEYRTDLMRRVLVTESVSYFELNPRLAGYYPTNTTEKIDQLLTIYGREFDEVRKYIEGISFAATVSYNKQGNVPDALIKDFAYYLGWDILSPMDENQLLRNFIPTQSNFSGMTVGYSPAEAEIEFWRRLILNSAFLWKSKGTRKGVEFFFDFLNVPQSLIVFNEYIYQAKSKIDVNKFRQILQYIYDTTDISSFNVDEDGYPKVPIDTIDMYFQKGGGWYRETAGQNAVIDYYEGNNAHIGPYDWGQEYLDAFRCLLDIVGGQTAFSGQTIKITEQYVEVTNLFSNYYGGTVDSYSGDVFVDPYDSNNNPTNCIIISGTVVENPSTEPEYNVCGCLIPSAITKAILITVIKNPNPDPGCVSGITVQCPSYLVYYGIVNGTHVWIDQSDPNISRLTTIVPEECCNLIGGIYNTTTKECGISATTITSSGDCPTDLIFLGLNNGIYYWVSGGTGENRIITNIVPQACCDAIGGSFIPSGPGSNTGICFSSTTTDNSSGNTNTNSGTTSSRSWRITSCSNFCDQTTAACGCVNPISITVYTNSNVTSILQPGIVLYQNQNLTIPWTGYFSRGQSIYLSDSAGFVSFECGSGNPC